MEKINKNNIELIVYDFDGVMTDNKVYIDQKGNEMVQVNRSDGLAISEIQKLGIKQVIISTEKNQVVSKRAKKLKIDCLQGISNKTEALANYCEENNYQLNNIGFVGNDINDFNAMKNSGWASCPADAHEDIKKVSDHIFRNNGGDGVIRELFDLLTIRRKINK